MGLTTTPTMTPVLLLPLLLCLLPLVPGSSVSSLSDKTAGQCDADYYDVYGHCVKIITEAGTWYEMKNICHNFGGQMVKVDDANFMYYLIEFLHEEGLDGYDYWIGASDEDHEGTFKWPDGTTVKMGSPYWGDNCDGYGQEPDGGTSQNCVFMGHSSHQHFFFFDY